MNPRFGDGSPYDNSKQFLGALTVNVHPTNMLTITSSSLVKVSLDGTIIDTRSGRLISRAGFVIHSAINAARPDAKFVIHLHTIDGMAVAWQEKGLLPLNRVYLAVLPQLAYHDYEGIALDTDECERLIADIGERNTMLLHHHGTLSASSRSRGRNTARVAASAVHLPRCLHPRARQGRPALPGCARDTAPVRAAGGRAGRPWPDLPNRSYG